MISNSFVGSTYHTRGSSGVQSCIKIYFCFAALTIRSVLAALLCVCVSDNENRSLFDKFAFSCQIIILGRIFFRSYFISSFLLLCSYVLSIYWYASGMECKDLCVCVCVCSCWRASRFTILFAPVNYVHREKVKRYKDNCLLNKISSTENGKLTTVCGYIALKNGCSYGKMFVWLEFILRPSEWQTLWRNLTINSKVSRCSVMPGDLYNGITWNYI